MEVGTGAEAGSQPGGQEGSSRALLSWPQDSHITHKQLQEMDSFSWALAGLCRPWGWEGENNFFSCLNRVTKQGFTFS